MRDEELQKYLEVANEAVKAAGEGIVKKFRHLKTNEVWRKEAGEIVTSADVEAERVIRDVITRAFPDHDILGEERGLSDESSSFRWFVDPIDGTGNFTQGNPHFAVSLALADGDELLVSVITAPEFGHHYQAVRGGGATKDGHPIHVSDFAHIKGAPLVWCEGHTDNADRAVVVKQKLVGEGAVCERLGSAALECASVAEGAYAAYFTTEAKPWDVAAGKLIIEEAGGRVTNFSGQPFLLSPDDFLASNGNIHTQLIALLAAS